MGDCDDHKFEKPRSSKPFQIRLNEAVEDHHLKRQKIKAIQHPEIPPWFIPEIDCCKKEISRKNKSEEEIKARFLDHDKVHSGDVKIYTDGSKSVDGVGCAVIHDDSSYVAKLSDSASVFTSELSAIIKALESTNFRYKESRY